MKKIIYLIFGFIVKNINSINLTFFIGLIGFISNDKILPLETILATCDQPPGQEPRSNKKESFLIILNFSINSISLKDALDLYPNIFDF